jgi:hypothetical protein
MKDARLSSVATKPGEGGHITANNVDGLIFEF